MKVGYRVFPTNYEDFFNVFLHVRDIYWTNKVRDQTFNALFLQDFELLVK